MGAPILSVVADEDVLSDFGQNQRRRGLMQSTIETRRTRLGLFLRSVDDPFTVTPEDVSSFIDSRHVEARTVYGWLSTLHVFYRWAIKAGHTTVDPTESIDRPRLRRLLPRPIATDDLSRAVAAAEPMMRAWLLLAALAGLRCREVAELRREDIVDTMEPSVLLVAHGKGDKPRAVPLHPDLWRALLVAGLPRAGRLWSVPAWKVSHAIRDHLHGLGIEASAHQLRHWFGTMIYAESQDLRVTQELLGHASITTTAGYVAWSQARAADAVRRLAF